MDRARCGRCKGAGRVGCGRWEWVTLNGKRVRRERHETCDECEGTGLRVDVAPTRGEVEGFSRKSRLRLQRFVAQLDQAACGRPLFVTLTYPGAWEIDPRVWKRDLKVFGQRMRREFPGAWWLWRLEPQRRGAPHYHLLVFGIDWLPIEWLSRTWFEVVGSGDRRHLAAGTQVQRVESWRGVMSYVSKYIAKMPEDLPERWRHVGRWWGVENRAAVPICVVRVEVSRAAWFKVRRWVRRLRDGKLPKRAHNRWRSRGGATAFLSNEGACRLIAFAEAAAELEGEFQREPGLPRGRTRCRR